MRRVFARPRSSLHQLLQPVRTGSVWRPGPELDLAMETRCHERHTFLHSSHHWRPVCSTVQLLDGPAWSHHRCGRFDTRKLARIGMDYIMVAAAMCQDSRRSWQVQAFKFLP